jgi:VWFA-related protein
MKPRLLPAALISLIMICISGFQGQAQTPGSSPQPTPPATESQEKVKVFTEEVVIPVSAYDNSGHLSGMPEPNDVIVFEDDVRQEIKSIRRVPVNVLLLLDTGGELNPAMSVRTTREIATHLIFSLRAGDRMAALQFGNRLELIQDWTTERNIVALALKAKLSSGKRSRLTDALAAAATKMKEAPSGTRHLVLITDGVGAAADDAALVAAIEQVLNSNVTVHVISYTAIGRKAIQKKNPLVKLTTEKRKTAKDIADEIMNPIGTPEYKKKNKIYVVIDTDLAMRRRRAEYKDATKESEQWLSSLADETGGMMLLATSAEEMIRRSEEVAREIDSQYVVTYRPTRPLALATAQEYRRLRVVPGRGGLEVHARRGYVAKPQ